jgi:hypothetical protein
MSTTRVKMQPAIIGGIEVDADRLTLYLTDGRELSAPTSISPRLHAASPAQRANWTIEGLGTIVHWPDIDEDIGVWTLLGVPEDLVLEAAGFKTPG